VPAVPAVREPSDPHASPLNGRLGRPPGLRAGFHATVEDPASGLHHAGEQWAPAWFMIEPHTHPVWEIYLQMHGVTHWVAAGQAYQLPPAGLLAVAPEVPHHLAGPARANHHFYFAAIDLAPVLRRHPGLADRWRQAPAAIHRSGAGALAEPFAQLVQELTIRRDYPAEGLALAVDRILLAVTRLLAPPVPASRLAVHPAVRTVRELMDREFDQRWTLGALAARVGLAPGYLAGLFTAQLGQPPHQYLNERRIDRARQLLASSDLSITAISVELGFSSSQHFARAFRQAAGCTPSAYRAAAH
jgi:AraC-like DNA-binding protein